MRYLYFLQKTKPYTTLVNIFLRNRLNFSIFARSSMLEHCAMTEHTLGHFFVASYLKFFGEMFIVVLLDGILVGFFKFLFFK
jgi:hypothetical protein